MSQTKTQYPTSLPVLALKGVVVLPPIPTPPRGGGGGAGRALERCVGADGPVGPGGRRSGF